MTPLNCQDLKLIWCCVVELWVVAVSVYLCACVPVLLPLWKGVPVCLCVGENLTSVVVCACVRVCLVTWVIDRVCLSAQGRSEDPSGGGRGSGHLNKSFWHSYEVISGDLSRMDTHMCAFLHTVHYVLYIVPVPEPNPLVYTLALSSLCIFILLCGCV